MATAHALATLRDFYIAAQDKFGLGTAIRTNYFLAGEAAEAASPPPEEPPPVKPVVTPATAEATARFLQFFAAGRAPKPEPEGATEAAPAPPPPPSSEPAANTKKRVLPWADGPPSAPRAKHETPAAARVKAEPPPAFASPPPSPLKLRTEQSLPPMQPRGDVEVEEGDEPPADLARCVSLLAPQAHTFTTALTMLSTPEAATATQAPTARLVWTPLECVSCGSVLVTAQAVTMQPYAPVAYVNTLLSGSAVFVSTRCRTSAACVPVSVPGLRARVGTGPPVPVVPPTTAITVWSAEDHSALMLWACGKCGDAGQGHSNCVVGAQVVAVGPSHPYPMAVGSFVLSTAALRVFSPQKAETVSVATTIVPPSPPRPVPPPSHALESAAAHSSGGTPAVCAPELTPPSSQPTPHRPQRRLPFNPPARAVPNGRMPPVPVKHHGTAPLANPGKRSYLDEDEEGWW